MPSKTNTTANSGITQDNRRNRYSGAKPKDIGGDETIGKVLAHIRHIRELPPIDRTNQEAVKDRVDLYFTICEQDYELPTMENLAKALGMTRQGLFEWIRPNGTTTKGMQERHLYTIKNAKDEIASAWVSMAARRKLDSMMAAFVLTNSDVGYVNTNEYKLTHTMDSTQDEPQSTDDLRAKLARKQGK